MLLYRSITWPASCDNSWRRTVGADLLDRNWSNCLDGTKCVLSRTLTSLKLGCLVILYGIKKSILSLIPSVCLKRPSSNVLALVGANIRCLFSLQFCLASFFVGPLYPPGLLTFTSHNAVLYVSIIPTNAVSTHIVVERQTADLVSQGFQLLRVPFSLLLLALYVM